LWNERRLLFDGRQGVADAVDDCSARLVAAALRRGERLMVTLPDFQPHRPAFLFATALVRHFLDSGRSIHAAMLRSGPVLYFGPTVGIRDQLRCTSLVRPQLNFGEVFSQQDVSRGATGTGRAGSSAYSAPTGLPLVVTVYAPADPVAVVRSYRPCWIAVDCCDAPSLIWLQPLLGEAAKQGIPVIAWGQNPLSECVNDFAAYGQVFKWPWSIQLAGNYPSQLSGDPASLLYTQNSSRLLPLVLQDKSLGAFGASLRDASQILGRAVQRIGGSFARDAVAVHWKYLRSLEALAVPADFYEAEAPRFWGLQPLGKLQIVCDRFRAACMQSDPHLYGDLEAVAALLNDAKSSTESQGSALWAALSNLCIEDPANDEVRILVFTSDSRKKLFLFAMLARHNITEDDLSEIRTHLVSLGEFRRWMHSRHRSSEAGSEDAFLMPSKNVIWHPVLVGLPSPMMTPRLLSVFFHPKVDIVLYPHQCSSFMRRQAQWSTLLSGETDCNVGALARLSRLPVPVSLPPAPARVTVDEAVEVNIKTTVKTKTSTTGPIWLPEDAVGEVARLFQADEESAAEEIVVSDRAEAETAATAQTSEEIWCAEAIKVQFDQSWHIYFAPDDVINVVRDGTFDLRYVRSLRTGEHVLLIHGQQRQSLYDLIISRVHRHPSIELHLALIRRWQEDLRMAYQQWRKRMADSAELQAYGARDVNGLLRRMRARGSELISTLTLSFWLRGLVLCPLEPEDLRRVAEILDMGFVRQYHGRIVQAANRLRGLHRGLSLKLSHWLQEHAAGAAHKSDDDVIDAELGLTFGDLRNSLLILCIIGIQNVTGPFLRINLGRAEKDT